MGLDAVDLLFRLEKRFGIEIGRDEIPAILFHTAGTLHQYLVAKVRGEYRQAPQVEQPFLEVGQAVNRIRGRWKLAFTSDLNRLFGPTKRAATWQALEEALGVELPPLEHRPDHESLAISRWCDFIVALTYWIVENHPERVEWVPVNCQPPVMKEWTDDEVWTAMCECLSDVLGVDAQEVRPDSRLFDDLGME